MGIIRAETSLTHAQPNLSRACTDEIPHSGYSYSWHAIYRFLYIPTFPMNGNCLLNTLGVYFFWERIKGYFFGGFLTGTIVCERQSCDVMFLSPDELNLPITIISSTMRTYVSGNHQSKTGVVLPISE